MRSNLQMAYSAKTQITTKVAKLSLIRIDIPQAVF